MDAENEIASALLSEIFRPLNENRNEFLSFKFMDHTDARPVVVVGNLVRPSSVAQFLYHLALTMGSFVTELDFSKKSSALEFLTACNLLETGNEEEIRNSINKLFERYVKEDLGFHPLTSQTFAKALLDAKKFFQFLLEDEYQYDFSYNEAEFIERTEFELSQQWQQTNADIIDAARCMNMNVPDVLDETYNPELEQFEGQSDESFLEQTEAFEICKNAIDKSSAQDIFVRFPVLTGSPGTGKTHILMKAAIYALSRSRKVLITSLTGERARSLAGLHYHLLFGIKVSKGHVESAQFVIQNTVMDLQKKPAKLARLLQCEIICLDEIGMFNSESITILDKVLQMITKRDVPFGGKLLICSGDSLQLPPISGHSLWLSCYMLTCFKIYELKEYVRSADDNNLRRAISLVRNPIMTEEDIEELKQIISDGCNYVKSWNEVPQSAMRIVSTRRAEKEVISKYLIGLNANGIQLCEFQAIDEISNINGVWIPAQEYYSRTLDRACLEPFQVSIYPGAVVRMTYNQNYGPAIFNQGQLALVDTLPDQNLAQNDQTLGLVLIPPGTHNVDNRDSSWKSISVKRHTTSPIPVGNGNQNARRIQWPITLNLASTVHKVIGLTCEAIGTELNQNMITLRLWQKEQFLVLISRVKRLNAIYFVGHKKNVLDCIDFVSRKPDKWRKHVYEVVHQCSVNTPATEPIRLSPFQAFYQSLPAAECVYILLSQNGNKTYIGQTEKFT